MELFDLLEEDKNKNIIYIYIIKIKETLKTLLTQSVRMHQWSRYGTINGRKYSSKWRTKVLKDKAIASDINEEDIVFYV